jgi:GNAT superfamily N-acetyltransferase
MERDHAALFVAEADGRPIGVAAVYLLKNHRSDIFARQSAYVSNVWVEPAHRRQGIATALTRDAIDWARAKGCEVVRLRSSQMGRPVYASLGFTPSDEMELRLDEPEHP